MRIWIDATHPNCQLSFVGMTVLEYQLRVVRQSEQQIRSLTKIQQALAGKAYAGMLFERFLKETMRPGEVRIELPADAPIPTSIPQDLLDSLQIRWSRRSGSAGERLQDILTEADGEPVIALSGDSIIDVRVLEDLTWGEPNRCFAQGEGAARATVARLDGVIQGDVASCEDLPALVDHALANGTAAGPVKQLDESSFESWIGKLRRVLDPYIFRITDDARRKEVEYFLFKSNYKGATDFMTAYAYPPIVWALVQPLARHRVAPNAVTAVSIVATFAAIPFFAAGQWLPGLILAYTMSILDSVDGKLARLTFTSSAQGDTLDHGLDIIHPPLWYIAWAWGLSGGDPTSPLITACMWMFLVYMLDRVLETLFKASTGQSIHGYEEIDVRFRTFLSRRNTNLAVFTIALPLGLGVQCFYLIVVWQVVCALFHLWRVIKFWNINRGEGELVETL